MKQDDDAGSNRYHRDDKLEVCLRNLVEEVQARMETTLRSGHLGALTYHPTAQEVKAVASAALESHIREHIAKMSNGRAELEIVSAERKRLRDSYLASFPAKSFRILDICWAAGQHYSEWKRWLRGDVKDGSAPDRAFRPILVSKTPPTKYRKGPRPKRWK
jgi:hypothetical protein